MSRAFQPISIFNWLTNVAFVLMKNNPRRVYCEAVHELMRSIYWNVIARMKLPFKFIAYHKIFLLAETQKYHFPLEFGDIFWVVIEFDTFVYIWNAWDWTSEGLKSFPTNPATNMNLKSIWKKRQFIGNTKMSLVRCEMENWLNTYSEKNGQPIFALSLLCSMLFLYTLFICRFVFVWDRIWTKKQQQIGKIWCINNRTNFCHNIVAK